MNLVNLGVAASMWFSPPICRAGLEIGVVDPNAPGVAEGISALLTRSIHDARASVGGHLPDWLVEDIKRNYTSASKVRTLWAATGHRFAVVRGDEIVATLHVAREHDTIFTVNREVINVKAREYPGFKPDRYHHVVNISTKHELRRTRVAHQLLKAICHDFREWFAGDGLWFRADPPWHSGLLGLGFVHDPRGDIFLSAEAERTAGLPHAAFNQRYACACQPQTAEHQALMATNKLQYVSMLRPFRARGSRILEVTPGAVVVEAGATWAQVLDASPPGAVPFVVPAWLGATVGGTLATRTFGKGSFISGFLEDHVQATRVENGVILEARISLMPAKPCVTITTAARVPHTSLAAALLRDPEAYHVTAFRSGDAFDVVTARLADQGEPLAAYLRGARIDLDAPEPHRSFEPALGPHADADQIVPIDRGRRYALLRWPREA